MKKVLSMLLIGAMLFMNAASAFAVDSASVTITITINHSKDIVVGTLAISITPGETKVSDALTVENTGSGIDLTVTLESEAVPAGWSTYYQFAATKPEVGDANWVASSVISEALAHGVTKDLYLKLVAPVPPIVETSVDLTLNVKAN